MRPQQVSQDNGQPDIWKRNPNAGRLSGSASNSDWLPSGRHATRPSGRTRRTIPLVEPRSVFTRSPGLKSAEWHRLSIISLMLSLSKDAGDVMRQSRHDFASPSGWQVREESRGKLTSYVGEGVAIEEKERSAAMALPQELYGFVERQDLLLLSRPVACARPLSLLIKAVLRASSCARSSVEADDKLPTPVFEKLGSGL